MIISKKLKKNLEEAFDKWAKLEKEQIWNIYKVGTMDEKIGFFHGTNWNSLNCSVGISTKDRDSEIVKLIRERRPNIFKPYENNKIYQGQLVKPIRVVSPYVFKPHENNKTYPWKAE